MKGIGALSVNPLLIGTLPVKSTTSIGGVGAALFAVLPPEEELFGIRRCAVSFRTFFISSFVLYAGFLIFGFTADEVFEDEDEDVELKVEDLLLQ